MTSETMPRYTWWDQVPETLTTKTKLDEAGLKAGGPVRAKIEYGRGRRHKVYDLYDRTEATPKQQATPAQLAALQRGRETAERNRQAAIDAELRAELAIHDAARDEAILWARELLAADDWVILDTETTGLGDDAEIIQLGILAPDGTVLCDQLLRPAGLIPPEATAIHGITDAMVAEVPTFADMYEQLKQLLAHKRIVAFNRDFDRRMWVQTRRHYGLRGVKKTWGCAMLAYAAYCNDWSDHYESYRWYPLPGGDHTAIGDARATLELIKRMAAARLSTELSPEEAEKLGVEAYYIRLEDKGIHPDDDPAQWQKVT